MANYIALLLVLLPISVYAQSDVLRCTYDVGRGEGNVSGTATVESRNGTVQRVEFDLSLVVAERSDYDVVSTCNIDVSRDGKETRWSEARGVIRVEFPDRNIDADYLIVSRTRDGYLVDFRRTDSYLKCGASAELPRSVRIPSSGAVCMLER